MSKHAIHRAASVAVLLLLAGCKEPNQTPAPAVDAAAATLRDAPVELDAQARSVGLKPDALCNLERGDGKLLDSSTPFKPAVLNGVVFAGWIADGVTRTVPASPLLVFKQTGGERVWQYPLTLDVKRDDVAHDTGAQSLANVGFSANVNLTVLPPGTYRVLLVHEREGVRYACDNGRNVLVGG